MPRVDIFVRVRNDSGEDNGHATFSLEPQLINELSRHFTPEHLAAYFGDLIRVQCMQVLYRVPGLPQDGVSSVRSWGVEWEGMGDPVGDRVRDSLVERLRDYSNTLSHVDPNEQIPSNFAISDPAFMREVEDIFQANSPFQEPEPNDPLMEQGEFVAETPEQFAERMLVEDGVESPEEARARFISRLQEALSRRDPVRGRQEHGVMLDDAAHFAGDQVDAAPLDFNTEFPISDIAIPQDPERRRQIREAFSGGSVESQQPNQLTSGIEPVSPFTGQRRRRNQEDTKTTPETNEDRSDIPTRYQRKPVI